MAIEALLIEEALTTGIFAGKYASESLLDRYMERYRKMKKIKRAIENDPSELIRSVIKIQARGALDDGDGISQKSLGEIPISGYLPKIWQDKIDYMFPGRMPEFVSVDARPNGNGHFKIAIVMNKGYGEQIKHVYEVAIASSDSVHVAKQFLRSIGFSIGIV